MSALGTVLTWVCAGVVALPLSPCAFITTARCPRRVERQVEVTPEPSRTCCADHARPAEQPVGQQREKPCAGECCRLSPFAPTCEKLVMASPAGAFVAMLPHFDESPLSVIVRPTSAVLQPLSLNILHCQWRC